MKNTGAERAEERAVLKAQYEAGASIRTIAAANGHSYGYVHDALVATGTQLRGRGGPNNPAGCRRRAREAQSSPALD
ncbi:helix-turn-helix domain-containing protein [Mycobacteroides abscessus]|uniref:helix-turn-helix domain-containing protein n=1 Tax=Mycobacteroides abscessus TaxID=36809 RepID=UPI0005E90DBC|nr:helix-turn-helix domain-containing protein [Mycobacteroides abscessus]MBN7410417.1 transcriptional regulator [Mycobacteroides abscessus subsp. abscessus]MDO3199516.1 helix-turn-helix domain-containing protein [Mycobacteroides abscessus subsp. abscessus]PVB42321.1 transcriptional regulator [Mycobacteroides abscessus]RIU04912.1 transcriptional regulator [Mycobacteroides abscessus]CPR81839.1 transcriptional regulator [Mycobacteroides abscessus]